MCSLYFKLLMIIIPSNLQVVTHSTVLLPWTIGLVVKLSFCLKLINILHFFGFNFILCGIENLWISLTATFSKLIPFLGKISNGIINEFNPQMPFTQKIVGHYSKQNLTQFRPLYDTSPGRLPIRKSYLEKRNQNVLTFCQCEGRRRLRKFNS